MDIDEEPQEVSSSEADGEDDDNEEAFEEEEEGGSVDESGRRRSERESDAEAASGDDELEGLKPQELGDALGNEVSVAHLFSLTFLQCARAGCLLGRRGRRRQRQRRGVVRLPRLAQQRAQQEEVSSEACSVRRHFFRRPRTPHVGRPCV